ncbi:Uncharacterised protein [uncultured archaeon]|nr:Uncharacterised protein [uncultured archaeon]
MIGPACSIKGLGTCVLISTAGSSSAKVGSGIIRRVGAAFAGRIYVRRISLRPSSNRTTTGAILKSNSHSNKVKETVLNIGPNRGI